MTAPATLEPPTSLLSEAELAKCLTRMPLLDLEDVSAVEQNRLLLLTGTLCVKADQRDLWSRIWRLWHVDQDVREDEFAVLEELSALARAG